MATHLERGQEEEEDGGGHREVHLRHRGYLRGPQLPALGLPHDGSDRERCGRERLLEHTLRSCKLPHRRARVRMSSRMVMDVSEQREGRTGHMSRCAGSLRGMGL